MFPVSILVGSYGASNGGGNGGGGNTITYDSFYTVAQPTSYAVEFNSKIYTFGLISSGRIYESSDDGLNWTVTTSAGTNLSCAGATSPVVESSRILWINGASNNNALYEWDGSTAASAISTGLTFNTNTGITLFKKIGNYYYIGPGTNGELYRSTSLTSGWTSVITVGGGNGHQALVEDSGTIVLTTDSALRVTSNDWATISTSLSLGTRALATDGSGNWLGAGYYQNSDGRGRFSTNDGITWANTSSHLRPPGETTGNINVPQEGLIYLNGKWVWLSAQGGFDSLISTTDSIGVGITTTLEKDFVNYTYNLSKVNNTLLVAATDGSNYGFHRLTIS